MAGLLTEKEVFEAVQPELLELEKTRINLHQQLKKFDKKWMLTIGAAIAGGIVLWVLFPNIGWLFGILAVVGVLMALRKWGIEVAEIRKPYVNAFKDNIVEKLVRKIDPSMDLVPDEDIEEEHIKKSRILAENYHHYYCDDLITGTIEGHDFKFGEVKLTSDVKDTESIDFKGAFGVAELKAAIPSPIWIVPDSTNRFRDALGFKSDKGEVILFDHPEFEKIYKVYATEPDYAKGFLTHGILDQMTRSYQDVYSFNKIKDSVKFAFIEDKMYISCMIDDDLFEPRTRKPVNDFDYFAANVRYLLVMVNLIKTLDYDRVKKES